ncbi:prepilin-type N-terminal cleavage/methylation domain-containing protein [Vibrio palustris]|uniref:Pseudopilin GspJ n=1 Tax=Vibrio palustris TaxID=1918946 RepID=A0A1R4B161_9VIBR|nr:prepilin-type N-terminal cleavage/methylation domain-containing protein [Vibrio palustris]SJL82643.1 hypothetical protein VPAL9027_00574 [Vibrio palustris]
MFIHRVNQQGFSLLELLVALTLGSAIIGSLSRLFVQLERSVQQQQQAQQLHQQTAAIVESIALELRRAGYHRHQGLIATFAGETLSVVTSQHGSALGIIYQLPPSQDTAEYLHMVYRYQASEQQLLLCESLSISPATMAKVMRSTRSEPCYQVVDPLQYRVTAWFADNTTFVLESGALVQEVSVSVTLQSQMSDIPTDTQQITRMVLNGGYLR